MSRLRAVALASLCLLAACRKPQPQSSTPSPTLDGIAHAYIRLAVALGEHDADSIDYYVGPPEWVADIRRQAPSATEIRHTALDQLAALQALPPSTDPTRRAFLAGQLQAVACRAASLAGVHASFDDESRCAFGYTAPATLDEPTLASARARILSLIGPGRGTPARRLGAYESKFVIPPQRLAAVMKLAIAGCRAQTVAHLKLPVDESIQFELVGHEPWAGYSLYKGSHKSVISINAEFPVTIDRALDLACHETYPGHHTWNMIQDDRLARHGAIELLVQPTYSPQSLQSEAAATIAVDIAFPPEERARFEREILFPAAGLHVPSQADESRYLQVEEQVARLQPAIAVIARSYLDGDLEFARASERLENEALLGNSFESLKYLNEFRVYIVTYTCGPDILNRALAQPAGVPSQRWEAYLHRMTGESTLTPSVH